jgi:hypothetical protein
MPRLDNTALEEGLQHLPGWERRGNRIVKTFVREDFTPGLGRQGHDCRHEATIIWAGQPSSLQAGQANDHPWTELSGRGRRR